MTDGVLKALSALQKPYKFVVTAVFMQRAGGGLHTAAAAVWDAKKDGMCVTRRPRARLPARGACRAGARALRPPVPRARAAATWRGKTAPCTA